jgi:transcriptional regulator with XRE-family HTH domain
MTDTLIEKLTKTPDGMRLYQQERAIQELTDLVCELMDEQHVTRADLARRLGKTPGYITQLLDGRANMTIRTIADVLHALNRALHFQDGPVRATVSPSPILSISEGFTWAEDRDDWVRGLVFAQQPVPGTSRLAG